MEKKLEAVTKFHEKFGHPVSPKRKLINSDRSKLRFELMKEENEEYLTATKENNLVEVADSLGDMLYILCGTIIEHGLQNKITDVFNEIQKSNMSKLGADGLPIYREDGKILKGPNYFKPDIKKVLNSENLMEIVDLSKVNVLFKYRFQRTYKYYSDISDFKKWINNELAEYNKTLDTIEKFSNDFDSTDYVEFTYLKNNKLFSIKLVLTRFRTLSNLDLREFLIDKIYGL